MKTAALLERDPDLAGAMSTAAIRELLDLLERARYDLEQGWTEAAYDALGRAQRLIPTATK